MREMKNPYKIVVGRSQEKGQLQRYRCRWVDIIKINLRLSEREEFTD
jgi:hypothetical protein